MIMIFRLRASFSRALSLSAPRAVGATGSPAKNQPLFRRRVSLLSEDPPRVRARKEARVLCDDPVLLFKARTRPARA